MPKSVKKTANHMPSSNTGLNSQKKSSKNYNNYVSNSIHDYELIYNGQSNSMSLQPKSNKLSVQPQKVQSFDLKAKQAQQSLNSRLNQGTASKNHAVSKTGAQTAQKAHPHYKNPTNKVKCLDSRSQHSIEVDSLKNHSKPFSNRNSVQRVL